MVGLTYYVCECCALREGQRVKNNKSGSGPTSMLFGKNMDVDALNRGYNSLFLIANIFT